MKPIFVECYSMDDKAKLEEKGFTFLKEQSNSDKFVFLNDGKYDFSNSDLNINMHSNAYV